MINQSDHPPNHLYAIVGLNPLEFCWLSWTDTGFSQSWKVRVYQENIKSHGKVKNFTLIRVRNIVTDMVVSKCSSDEFLVKKVQVSHPWKITNFTPICVQNIVTDTMIPELSSNKFLVKNCTNLDCRNGHGKSLICSWKVREKSWNFVSKVLWELCV